MSKAKKQVDEMRDVCALPLVRRVAALVDRDPAGLNEGQPLPRGWHVALFAVATPQSQLRADGLAGLGVTLPNLGLPRIVAAGRRLEFVDDIKIGSSVRRESQTAAVTEKAGKSGPLAIVTIEHRIFVANNTMPVLIEQQDYIMLPDVAAGAGKSGQPPPVATDRSASDGVRRVLVPTETMLFRYCAITFNTHRIHYDLAYATGPEGYPALVVNGGLPILFLLEMLPMHARAGLSRLTVRNAGPLFCGRPVSLHVIGRDEAWSLTAVDDAGRIAIGIEAHAGSTGCGSESGHGDL